MVAYELVSRDIGFPLSGTSLKPTLARRLGWSMNQLLQIVNLGQDPELIRREYVSEVFNSLLKNYQKQLKGLEENVRIQGEVVDKIRTGIVRRENEIRSYERAIGSPYRFDMRRLYHNNNTNEEDIQEFSNADELEEFKAKISIDLETILSANEAEFKAQFFTERRNYSKAYEQALSDVEDELSKRTLAERALPQARESLAKLRSKRNQKHNKYVDLMLAYQRMKDELENFEVDAVSQQNTILAAARTENLSGTSTILRNIFERQIGEEAIARAQIACEAKKPYTNGNGNIIEATAIEVAGLEND